MQRIPGACLAGCRSTRGSIRFTNGRRLFLLDRFDPIWHILADLQILLFAQIEEKSLRG
jgi:hypothetical protein